MSTRAVYTFVDDHSTIHVYKHHDGYPEGGISFLLAAIEFAWVLPRFEADDFAAAFVRANKDGGGGVRLCGTGILEPQHAACDAEYHYTLTCPDGVPHVKVDTVSWWDEPTSETIFDGTLNDAVGQFIG